MIPSDNDKNAQTDHAAARADTVVPATSHGGAGAAPSRDVPAADSAAEQRRRSLSRWLGAGLVLAVIVIVALAATLRHQQQQLDAFGREATRRLDEVRAQSDAAQQQARQALTQSQGMESRLAELDQRAETLEEQQDTLTQSYRELLHSDDEAVLVNVEQSLMLAAEQLELAGRVPSAIAGLQVAEARLARAARPAFMPAQQAIARDLNRLRALPIPDISEIAARLDSAIASAGELPLAAVGEQATAADSQPAPQGGAASPPSQAPADSADASWWRRAWVPVRDWSARVRSAAAEELRELVHVRRIDQPDALLLAPEQSAWLRANLTLRLLDARMALMARETEVWRSDLDAAIQAVERYADLGAPQTRRLLDTLADLREIDPAPSLPGIEDSLAAVRALLASADANALESLNTQSATGE
jgi:uroporphyrin-3 C-methyltransferase